MKKYFLYIFILFISAIDHSFAQKSTIDSLENKLVNSSGKERVDLFNRLSDFYHYNDSKIAIEYAKKGIDLADSIGYQKGLAGGYGSLGFAYIGFDSSKALEYTKKALEIRRQINDEEGISTSLNVLGVIYYYSGDYLLSIEHHLNSIKMKEKFGNKVILATSYNNIALVYMAVEDYDKALEFLYKAVQLRIETNNIRSTGIIKTNIGEIYARIGNYEKAKNYFSESLKINKESASKSSIAYSYYCFANLYVTLKEYENAFNFYDSALVLYTEMDIKNGIANSENGIANVFKIKEDYDSSIYHANIALKLAEKINALDNISKASNSLYYCYQQKGNFKKAFEYLLLNKSIQDSLMNDDKLKKIAKIELDYKIEKMKQEQEQELNKQKTFNQYLVIILFSGGVILLVIIRSTRSKKLANQKLNELNSQLHEANSAKDRFISIIAHDLRGPYQSTLGLSGVLETEFNSLSEDEIKNSISNLNSSLKKQYELLNDLLKWANLHGGNFKITKEKLSLHKSINETFDLLELSAKKKKIILTNTVNNNLYLDADKNMLDLLLRNLISNSIKFSHEEGDVSVSAVEKEKNIQITVSDKGIGIELKELTNLFKIDKHFSRKGTKNEVGSGLGLILCKEIIEKHGGSIWVESEVNKGSRFIFTLPKSQS